MRSGQLTFGFNVPITSRTKDKWLTPPGIIRALGEFDLDPCAPIVRPWDTARDHYTLLDNGLLKPWFGRVWCNPPYGGKAFQWLARLAAHGDGIALVFARTETRGFHREVWDKADAVFFFEQRLRFFHADGALAAHAPAPSCLAIYGEQNVTAVAAAQEKGWLRGSLVLLTPRVVDQGLLLPFSAGR